MKIRFINRLGKKETIKEGIVLSNGILDGMMHYRVRWNDGTEDVTAALTSTKYRYIIED
jgi:hypothetical protein